MTMLCLSCRTTLLSIYSYLVFFAIAHISNSVSINLLSSLGGLHDTGRLWSLPRSAKTWKARKL